MLFQNIRQALSEIHLPTLQLLQYKEGEAAGNVPSPEVAQIHSQ